MGVEPLARVIRSAVREALLGGFVEREVEELILGGVFIEDRDERETPLHQDTPSALKEALRKAGLACELYYSRDGVPAYLANCVTDSGRRVALGLDVSLRDNYDPDTFLFPYIGINYYNVSMTGSYTSLSIPLYGISSVGLSECNNLPHIGFLFPYMGFALHKLALTLCRDKLSIPLYGISFTVMEMRLRCVAYSFLFPYMGFPRPICFETDVTVSPDFLFPYMGFDNEWELFTCLNEGLSIPLYGIITLLRLYYGRRIPTFYSLIWDSRRRRCSGCQTIGGFLFPYMGFLHALLASVREVGGFLFPYMGFDLF